MNTKTEEMIQELEDLSITTNPEDLDRAWPLFEAALDLFCYVYSMPGEPEAICDFCGANHALPGAYDVCDSDDMDIVHDDGVYWARVWATRALDILDPHYAEEPCCKERSRLLATFDL